MGSPLVFGTSTNGERLPSWHLVPFHDNLLDPGGSLECRMRYWCDVVALPISSSSRGPSLHRYRSWRGRALLCIDTLPSSSRSINHGTGRHGNLVKYKTCVWCRHFGSLCNSQTGDFPVGIPKRASRDNEHGDGFVEDSMVGSLVLVGSGRWRRPFCQSLL